ncbi:MAG: hypothetical protein K0U41_08635 [Gammaproteobacteria bacterium]|nr:hypothetical protein [Gammaproteobacteria bacterium]
MTDEKRINQCRITHVIRDDKGEITLLIGACIINGHPAEYYISKEGLISKQKEEQENCLKHYVLDERTSEAIYIKCIECDNGEFSLVTEHDGIKTNHLEELPIYK